MEKIESAYKNAIKETKINEIMENKMNVQLTGKNDFEDVFKIKEFYKKYDRIIASQLLDKGYPLRDVQLCIIDNSLFSQKIEDRKDRNNYCDEVMNEINNERILRSGKLYELAKETYLKKSTAIRDKYSNNSNYNEFQEGKVVVSMMRQGGYFLDVIESVLQKNSQNPNASPEYVKKIISSCLKVKENYLAIDSATKELHDATDCYKLFAKEYMKATKTSILNGRDEQKIIARMFGEGLEEADIILALQKASPVAIEPGRKIDGYINTIIAATKETYRKKKEYVIKNYPQTLEVYKQKIANKDKMLKSKGYQGIDYNRTYQDGLIVKEMLAEHYIVDNIEKAIREASPQAVKPSKFNPNKTPEGYAKWVRIQAQKAINAENEILNYQKRSIPRTSYQSLLIAGYTIRDLYRAAIAERIDVYPSVSNNLTSSFIDKDACEKLMNLYPDININDLKNALSEISPRAQLPGIPQVYPEMVLDETHDRRAIIEKKQQKERTAQEVYMKQCGLAAEGVDVEANMLMYHDGRAVLKMIQENIDKDEIKKAIVSGVKAMRVNISNPLKYANNVIEKASIVAQRLENIKEFNYEKNRSEMGKTDLYYCKNLKDMYSKKGYVSSSMDIDIVANMIANKFVSNDIHKTIDKLSPTAAEPGRDAKYQTFVINQAKEKVEQEKMKLKQYTVIPRIDHETTAEKEYEYHKNQLQNTIKLPLDETMDVMIAGAMLQQGFENRDIAIALKQNSPCVKEKVGYENIVLKSARKLLNQNLNLDVGLSMAKKMSY